MYLYPEIKPYLTEAFIQIFEKEILATDPNFLTHNKEKREIGENDSYICTLIRNDSIEDFITYTNRTNFPLNSKIEQNLYETNQFLIDNQPSLIEYSAFFGSIQIFQYLKINNVKLTSSLWLFAVHGCNPEIIHLLEESHVEPLDGNYKSILIESIKCHHNNIANYIFDNYIDKMSIINAFSDYIFRYYNFSFMLNDSLTNESIFFYSCKYDYYSIVKFLVMNKAINLKDEVSTMII